MSRHIIQRYVMPIVQQQLEDLYNLAPTQPLTTQLEDFFEHELTINFGIIGSANHCEQLEDSINESQKRDPVLFERYLRQTLMKFLQQTTKTHYRINGMKEQPSQAT